MTLLKGLYGAQEVCSAILHLTEEKVQHNEQKGEVRAGTERRSGRFTAYVSMNEAHLDVEHLGFI